MSSFILDIRLNNYKKTAEKHLATESFTLDYCTSAKFENDKVNYQNDNYYLLLDGIVLNKNQLLTKSNESNWTKYLLKAYKKTGNQFFKQLKGSYYGFLYDKKEEKWIVFTDHISSKPIYYAEYKYHICFANNYTQLVNHLKNKQQTVSLNEQAAWLLLTCGYVFEDITITNEIKRLMVGYYAVIQKTQLQFEKFYTLTNNPINISENEAIEEIDKRFRRTVQQAFEKDKEYGYKHIVTLSGGLDSRMTVWVAHELGYTNQLNLTWSQSNYLDETIAKQIAADLKHEWLFKTLDNGNFLMDIDEVTQLSGGNILYFGLAHGMSLYKYLNFDDLGILHTGMEGEDAISTTVSSLNKNTQFTLRDVANSLTLLSKIKNQRFKEVYSNEEIFRKYIRSYYCANQGLLGILNYTETYSPYYDIDFQDFAVSIPLKLRFKHRLYKKWILKKYPAAAKYIWESDKVPVNYPHWVKIKGKPIPIKEIPTIVLAKLGYKKYGLNSKNHMNPLEYWYRTNSQLKTFMDNYYHENINLLDRYPQLQAGCKHLYYNSEGTEKIQVLSLLSAVKNHCK